MRNAAEKICNLGPINVKGMQTRKMNIAPQVTNPFPKENPEQGLEKTFDAVNGFMK